MRYTQPCISTTVKASALIQSGEGGTILANKRSPFADNQLPPHQTAVSAYESDE